MAKGKKFGREKKVILFNEDSRRFVVKYLRAKPEWLSIIARSSKFHKARAFIL
jgi:hypothetical protein